MGAAAEVSAELELQLEAGNGDSTPGSDDRGSDGDDTTPGNGDDTTPGSDGSTTSDSDSTPGDGDTSGAKAIEDPLLNKALTEATENKS